MKLGWRARGSKTIIHDVNLRSVERLSIVHTHNVIRTQPGSYTVVWRTKDGLEHRCLARNIPEINARRDRIELPDPPYTSVADIAECWIEWIPTI